MRCEDSGMFSQLNLAVDYVKLREYVCIFANTKVDCIDGCM